MFLLFQIIHFNNAIYIVVSRLFAVYSLGKLCLLADRPQLGMICLLYRATQIYRHNLNSAVLNYRSTQVLHQSRKAHYNILRRSLILENRPQLDMICISCRATQIDITRIAQYSIIAVLRFCMQQSRNAHYDIHK